jgi:hypothetical protein
MCNFKQFVLEPRQFNPTFPKAQLLELIEQAEQDRFLVDVDLDRMVLVIAVPCKSMAH